MASSFLAADNLPPPRGSNHRQQNGANNNNNNNSSNHSTTHHSYSSNRSNTLPPPLHRITPRLLVCTAPTSAPPQNTDANDAQALASFLNQQYGQQQYLLFNLTGQTPSESVLQAFAHQIVTLAWQSPGPSEAPGLATLLPWVYALQAWLHSDNASTIAIVYCSNGLTRSGLVTAAWLRATNKQVRSTRDAFLHFLQATSSQQQQQIAAATPMEIYQELPTSIHTLFSSWDDAMDYGAYIQRKPMLLRAIGLEGVPVQDAPIMEVWNVRGELLYSSAHSNNNVHWIPPDGLFRADAVVQGDFCIIARFADNSSDSNGNNNQAASSDASKWIFRYVHNTGFLSAAAPYELSADKVDIMKPFADRGVDPQEFLVTLVWESYWNCTIVDNDNNLKEQLKDDCTENELSPIYTDMKACDAGWKIIHQYHAVQPVDDQIQALQRVGELNTCPSRYISLALQLANNNPRQAHAWLWSGPMSRWWRPPSSKPTTTIPISDEYRERQTSIKEKNKQASMKILELIKGVDVSANVPYIDRFMGDVLTPKERANLPKIPPRGERLKPRDPARVRYNYKSCTMNVRVGDIQTAFGSRKSLHPLRRDPKATPLQRGARPEFPLMPRNPGKALVSQVSPLEDPDNASAVELLMKLDDPTITLQDLLDIKTMVRDCNAKKAPVGESTQEDSDKASPTIAGQVSSEQDEAKQSRESRDAAKEAIFAALKKRPPIEVTSNEDATPKNEGLLAMLARKSNAAPIIDRRDTEPALKVDPRFTKYYKMTVDGVPVDDITETLRKDTVDLAILNMDWEKSYASQVKKDEGSERNQSHEQVAMKDDVKYQKYWKMKSVGLSEGAIRNAMQRDGVDSSALELSWDKSYASQTECNTSSGENSNETVAMKDDLRFEKHRKLKDEGANDEQILGALQRDGYKMSVQTINWERSYASQTEKLIVCTEQDSKNVPIKEDLRFSKYWKMKKMGLPEGAIQNAMKRDGVDVSVLNLDWDKNYESQTGSKQKQVEERNVEPALKDDLKYAKYYKMRSLGLPDGAIRNAMIRDSVDTSVLELDWDKSLVSQQEKPAPGNNEPAIKDDPRFDKYWKMRSVGLPDGAIRNAMIRDGVDDSILSLDWEKSLSSQSGCGTAAAAAAQEVDNDPPIKDDPRFQKYWKMKNMGLPEGAVSNAMVRDEVDETILQLDWNKSLKSQRKPTETNITADTDPPLIDDEEYAKYFKMMKKGLPAGAVKNALVRDGKDPSIIDLDPNKSLKLQSIKSVVSPVTKPKKRVRRKKIFWNAIDPGQIKEDSLWSLVKGQVALNELKYDEQEFADLFTESADPGDKKKKTAAKESSKQKKLVQVIDGKKSMNGGIILLRLRMDYKVIADSVDNMQSGKLDATQLKALSEILPTIDEREGLLAYMKQAGESEEAKLGAYSEFSECEKYMYSMLNIEDAEKKLECMLFRAQFKMRLDDLIGPMTTIELACDEVRGSRKLRGILGMILVLVNKINTGGESIGAAGFNLDALLKLNEAKAFDKKTSVLQYLVKLVKHNDESLLDFYKDLTNVSKAMMVVLDSLVSDIKVLDEELGEVDKAAKADADRLEKSGRISSISLQELKEQRTSIRSIENVLQFNKIDHHTGRTPMERFTKSAGSNIKDAIAYVDKIKRKYQGLLAFFGEDQSMPSNDFFGTMTRFVTEFNVAAEQVKKEEMAKLKELKKRNKAQSMSPKGRTNHTGPDKVLFADLAKKAVSKAALIVDRRDSNCDNDSVNSGKVVPSKVGLTMAAAAAAAGATDESKLPAGLAEKTTKSESTTTKANIPSIAAAAAAAALKKRSQKTSGNRANATHPVASHLSLAAAAANRQTDSSIKRSQVENDNAALKGQTDVDCTVLAPIEGAEASQESNAVSTKSTSNDNNTWPLISSKSTGSNDEDKLERTGTVVVDKVTKDSVVPIENHTNDIKKATAPAEISNNVQSVDDSTDNTKEADTKPIEAPLSMAAAAAAAARKRNNIE